MTVILVLITFIAFLLADRLISHKAKSKIYVLKGTQITTPGYECLGALAQDGGEPIEEKK